MIASLELGFQLHFEVRKIDKVPARKIPAAVFPRGSCSKPMMAASTPFRKQDQPTALAFFKIGKTESNDC